MNTIVFDIETIPIDFESLDEVQKTYLLKFAENEEDEEKVMEQMALWAPTNKIVSIGMVSVDSQKGAVYFQNDLEEKVDFVEDGIHYFSGSEEVILQKFWNAIAKAHKFVTFNGRSFDCPVLMLRSAMLRVRPSKNLMPYRYSHDVHVDLLEQMTFYNSSRKFNLDFYCKAFGINSPKANGINGHDVKNLFAEREYMKIAKYCAGDLVATRELYLRWRDYMTF